MKNLEQVKIEPGENKKDEEALQELLVTHTQFSLLLIKDVKALKSTFNSSCTNLKLACSVPESKKEEHILNIISKLNQIENFSFLDLIIIANLLNHRRFEAPLPYNEIIDLVDEIQNGYLAVEEENPDMKDGDDIFLGDYRFSPRTHSIYFKERKVFYKLPLRQWIPILILLNREDGFQMKSKDLAQQIFNQYRETFNLKEKPVNIRDFAYNNGTRNDKIYKGLLKSEGRGPTAVVSLNFDWIPQDNDFIS